MLAILFLALVAWADGPPAGSIVGRVLDVEGNPVPGLTVAVAGHNKDFPLRQGIEHRAMTDAEGRFAFPAMRSGAYDVSPLAGPGRPLPAAFVYRKVDVPVAATGPIEVELKAVPHATFTARFVDAGGLPAAAGIGYQARGEVGGLRWWSVFPIIPGRADAIEVRVPLGLKDAQVECSDDFVWWTWAPEFPRQSHDRPTLAKVDLDYPEIVARRLKPGSLEVRIKVEGGEPPANPEVHVSYPVRRGAEGGPIPRKVAPGVYRLDRRVIPGREAQVNITAPGFKNLMTKPFRLTEEGQEGVVEVTLIPGVSDPRGGFRSTDDVAVTLKDRDGRPIVPPVEPEADRRSFACRLVDKATGAPIVGADVTFGSEDVKDEQGEAAFGTIERLETRSDADGRYVVTIPTRYLPPVAPRQSVRFRVTIRHPDYLDWFDTSDTREIASRGNSGDFLAPKLPASRTVTGRLLGPDGNPLGKVDIDKDYGLGLLSEYPRDGEMPETDSDGRFRLKVPIGRAILLNFRADLAANQHFPVAADATDLGDLRLSRGAKVKGRVFGPDGKPVKWISVMTPADPPPPTMGQRTYTTDPDGSFRTEELAPGRYVAHVGAIFRDDEGNNTGFAFKDAPGIYLPTPFTIRPDGKSEPAELDLRPADHVTFTARLTTTRPEPKDEDEDKRKSKPDPEIEAGADGGFFLKMFNAFPIINVKGKVGGVDWATQVSFAEMNKSKEVYAIRVPKALEDATLDLSFIVQRFRLAPDGPELFGPSFPLGRVTADRPEIHLRRYAPTILKVLGPMPLPAGFKVEARYLREPAMKAAGVVFNLPTPGPIGKVAAGDLRFSILPDEEVEVTATAPGQTFAPTRVKLAEGETREVTPATMR